MIVDLSKTEFSRRYPNIDISNVVQFGMTEEEQIGVYVTKEGNLLTTEDINLSDDDILLFLSRFHDTEVNYKSLYEPTAYYVERYNKAVKLRHRYILFCISILLGGFALWVLGLVWLKQYALHL